MREHPLKSEIYKNGYNMKNFSEKIGVSRFTLYDFFVGNTKKLRGDTINLIANGLGKSYDDIYEMCRNEK